MVVCEAESAQKQHIGRFAATPHQSQPGSEEPVCDSFSSRRSLCSSVKQLDKLKFEEESKQKNAAWRAAFLVLQSSQIFFIQLADSQPAETALIFGTAGTVAQQYAAVT